MTVGEVVEKLLEMPQDMVTKIYDLELGWNNIVEIKIQQKEDEIFIGID